MPTETLTTKTVLKFIVPAFNKHGEKCNPVPYKRTTQGSKWNKKYIVYTEWKQLVQSNFHQNFPGFASGKSILRREKPIKKSESQWLVVTKIYFKDGKRGDPDNVHKGILDALFEKDSNVSGFYYYGFDKDKPRVEVSIYRDSSIPTLSISGDTPQDVYPRHQDYAR